MDNLDKLLNDVGNMVNVVAILPEEAIPKYKVWHDNTFKKVGGFEGFINKVVSDVEEITGKEFTRTSDEENLKALMEINKRYNEREDII